MTTILVLPVYGFNIASANNEDLRTSWAYVDDGIAGATIYNGGSGFGGASFTGSLPVAFAPPASGLGRPGLGTAAVAEGTVAAITIDDPGEDYGVAELVELSITGAGTSLIAAVTVGHPLSLDGIAVDLVVRSSAADRNVILDASTDFAPGSAAWDAALVTDGNLLGILIPESVMRRITPGSYVFEVRARADGFVRVIAKGNFIVGQGVARDRI